MQPNIEFDADLLGRLAMQYRRSALGAARLQIAREYAVVVDRLIGSGVWEEAPPPEDQLPDEDMPAAFFEFWMRDESSL